MSSTLSVRVLDPSRQLIDNILVRHFLTDATRANFFYYALVLVSILEGMLFQKRERVTKSANDLCEAIDVFIASMAYCKAATPDPGQGVDLERMYSLNLKAFSYQVRAFRILWLSVYGPRRGHSDKFILSTLERRSHALSRGNYQHFENWLVSYISERTDACLWEASNNTEYVISGTGVRARIPISSMYFEEMKVWCKNSKMLFAFPLKYVVYGDSTHTATYATMGLSLSRNEAGRLSSENAEYGDCISG